jgi:hypothetical protein
MANENERVHNVDPIVDYGGGTFNEGPAGVPIRDVEYYAGLRVLGFDCARAMRFVVSERWYRTSPHFSGWSSEPYDAGEVGSVVRVKGENHEHYGRVGRLLAFSSNGRIALVQFGAYEWSEPVDTHDPEGLVQQMDGWCPNPWPIDGEFLELLAEPRDGRVQSDHEGNLMSSHLPALGGLTDEDLTLGSLQVSATLAKRLFQEFRPGRARAENLPRDVYPDDNYHRWYR